MKDIKKIEEKILKIAIEIAKSERGALFVVGDKVKYVKLLRQKFEPFDIFGKGAEKLLKSLATIDGATIIDKKGVVKAYGVMIKDSKSLVGYGTRHAAAFTASKNDNISILCSEEEHKVKIFKNGKYVMQIDALEKNVDKKVRGITVMLETIGAGFIGTIGVATIAPALGIALIPGVLIFGGSYYAIKSILERIKKRK